MDVQYAELLSDPIAAVRRVYDHLGVALSAEAETRMRAWLAAHPQNRHGTHRYQLDDFELTRADVDRAFTAYRERFAIPAEERT